jgi:hypothetical protein
MLISVKAAAFTDTCVEQELSVVPASATQLGVYVKVVVLVGPEVLGLPDKVAERATQVIGSAFMVVAPVSLATESLVLIVFE